MRKIVFILMVAFLIMSFSAEARSLREITEYYLVENFSISGTSYFNDTSGNANHGALLSGAEVSTATLHTKQSTSIKLYGTDDHMYMSVDAIKDDTKGFGCALINSSTSPAAEDLCSWMSFSDPDGVDNYVMGLLHDYTNQQLRFDYQDATISGGRRTFTAGSMTNGGVYFVCIGSTGTKYWAAINGTNQSVGMVTGSDDGAWLNTTTRIYETMALGANRDFTNRTRYDCNANYGVAIYGNDTPTTEEINISLWQNMTSPYIISGLPDTIIPYITGYSDQGSSCTNWNTDPLNACNTSDTTPTLYFNTSEQAFCAIGVSNVNYTTMGSSRNCTSGENSIEHACTLIDADELVNEDSTVYLSCKDNSGNMNKTSTSGGLKLTLPTSNFETSGRNAIQTGIQHALSGETYAVYTGQRIYARNSANNQSVGVFDKVVKWMNKIWAFNVITGNQTAVNMLNISPVLYALDIRNTTAININQTVYQLITNTK